MKRYNRFPFLSVALLAAWLVASAVVINQTDSRPDTPFLAYALLLFTAAVAAANLFRFSALLATLIGVGTYLGVMLTLRPVDLSLALPAGVGVIAIAVAGLLGWIASRQIALLQQKLIHANSLIDDLRVKDPDLGIVRLAYAMQTLKKETLRSQRYKSSLCLLLMDIADRETIQKEQGMAAYQDLKRTVCTISAGLIRELDLLFGEETLGIILPETNTEAAIVVAQRISDSLARKARIGVHVGVAEFGVDAFGENELYHAAETAMALAQRTDKPLVSAPGEACLVHLERETIRAWPATAQLPPQLY